MIIIIEHESWNTQRTNREYYMLNFWEYNFQFKYRNLFVDNINIRGLYNVSPQFLKQLVL